MDASPMSSAAAMPRAERFVYDSRTTAKLLGISVQRLNYWRRAGQGPDFIKLGTCVRCF
jgi:hypothetical protein